MNHCQKLQNSLVRLFGIYPQFTYLQKHEYANYKIIKQFPEHTRGLGYVLS